MRKTVVALVCPFAVLWATGSARAGGSNLLEVGSMDVGMASAGRAALAEDAATVFGNPAGMARLERHQLLAGLGISSATKDFDVDPAGTSFGDKGGDAGGTSALPTLAYVHTLGDRWRLGGSLGALSGGSLDYPSGWAGRYYAVEARLTAFEAHGSVSYRLHEQWSLGAGLRLLQATLEQKTALNNSGGADGQLKIEDDDAGVSLSLGVLYEPSDAWRIGLRYRSKTEVEFEDRPRFTGVGPALGGVLQAAGLLGAELKLEIELPQDLLLSIYHQLNERWELTFNLGWENWEDYGRKDITIASTTSTSFTQETDFDDTWHLALGGRYRLGERWRLSAGFAYDSSPMDPEDRTPATAPDRQIRLAAGAQYDLGENITLGATYVFLDGGDGKIERVGGPLRGNLQGEFSPNRVHTLTANLVWRF